MMQARKKAKAAVGKKPKVKKKASPPRGRAETREALLKAASELFGGKGPEAVSVRDVASLAGVNQGLVHRHFGSKENLIRDLLERDAAEFRKAAANTKDLPTALKKMFGVIEESPAFIRIIAYLLLEGYPPSEYLTQKGGLAVLTALANSLQDGDPHLRAAIFASRIMGWLLFEPYLIYSSGYHGDPKEARAEALRGVLEDAAALLESTEPSPMRRSSLPNHVANARI
jgi:TetR/AcrR family transcriptional regulator, repressor for neighboring sulfatase